MLEISSIRKNKVNLSDYNSEQDILNRMLMSNFSAFDLQVLSEILYSPLKISLKKLCRSIGCSEKEILPILEQLTLGGLLSIQEDNILVDKEMRKYFEFQITRFDADFKPDMEFLQGLLKKVPIHCLPAWHAIPRSSNNIFESIVEKYLLSPQIFHRYLSELSFATPTISSILSDLFSSPDFKIASTDVISKYNLTRRQFDETLLLLEFSFVCCLTYERQDDHWIEYITPFYEWRQYLRFFKQTDTPSIDPKETIHRKYPKDFSFIEDMSSILEIAQKKAINLRSWKEGEKVPLSLAEELAPKCSFLFASPEEKFFTQNYLGRLLEKICMIKLAQNIDGRLHFCESAAEWLDMSLESRSLYLYRHPLNRLLSEEVPPHIATERNVREAEKSIKRVLRKEWMFFDDFVKGVLVPLHEDSVIMLKKTGKQWRYTLPSYGEAEKSLIKATLLEWLFETGMTIPGTCQGKDCFSITAFGKFFFEE